jgi:hypothetical protein
MFLLNKGVNDTLTPSDNTFLLPGRIKRSNSGRYHIDFVTSRATRIIEQAFVEFAVNSLGYCPLGVWDWEFNTGCYNENLVSEVFPNLDEPIEQFLTTALERSIDMIGMGFPVNNDVLNNHYSCNVHNDIVRMHRQKLEMHKVKTDMIRIEFDLISCKQSKTFQFYPLAWYYLKEEEVIAVVVQNQPCYVVSTNYVDPESSLSQPVWQNPVQQLIGSDLKKWFQEKNFRNVEEAFEFTQKTIHGAKGWKNKIFRQANDVKTEISLYEFERLLDQ